MKTPLNFKSAKMLAICLTVLLVAGCDRPPRKSIYIETEKGLVSFSHGYCVLGMLVNNDRVNIRDENNKPITCVGRVRLTKEEARNFGN